MTTISYTIPPTLPTGQYNLTVETDYRKHVFEYNQEDNNLLWKVIDIVEEHPDLSFLSESTVQIHTSNEGNRLFINYTVMNTGIGPTFGSTWRDIVVITSLQNTSAIQLQSYIHNGLLRPRNNYTRVFQISLQEAVVGNYVLRIQTDVDQRITEENENNNIFISRLTIPAVHPDLFIYNVSRNLEQNITAGQMVELTWFVRNIGNRLAQGPWQDAVFIDSSTSFSSSSVHLSTVVSDRSLLSDQEYQQTLNVTIPIILSGDVNIFVYVDEHMDLFENGIIMNNIIHFPLLVVAPPSPDLRVSSINYTQILTESNERVLVVSWTVTNIGNSMEQPSSWRDEIFLSKTATFNKSESVSIGYNNIRNLTLSSNQTYSTSATAVLNANISGYHYVFVVTDSSGEQLELNGELNNIERFSDRVDIIPAPQPRLKIAINGSNYPDSLTSGSALTVSYNVTNIGERSIALSSWTDQIYLLSQSGLDRAAILENGMFLGEIINNRELEIHGVYSVSTIVSLPYGLNRYVYIAVVVDINENLGDPSVIGDMQMLHSLSSHSFLIENGPLPDLVTAPLLTSTTFRSGEPASLRFQVMNQGDRATSGLWYDTIYLSRNAALDEFDIRLRTINNNGSLQIQSAYTQNVTAFIPYNLPSSEYYLFFETDVGDRQLEIYENNNVVSTIVNIQSTVSTDLVLDEVSASPDSLHYGQGKSLNRKHVCIVIAYLKLEYCFPCIQMCHYSGVYGTMVVFQLKVTSVTLHTCQQTMNGTYQIINLADLCVLLFPFLQKRDLLCSSMDNVMEL